MLPSESSETTCAECTSRDLATVMSDDVRISAGLTFTAATRRYFMFPFVQTRQYLREDSKALREESPHLMVTSDITEALFSSTWTDSRSRRSRYGRWFSISRYPATTLLFCPVYFRLVPSIDPPPHKDSANLSLTLAVLCMIDTRSQALHLKCRC